MAQIDMQSAQSQAEGASGDTAVAAEEAPNGWYVQLSQGGQVFVSDDGSVHA